MVSIYDLPKFRKALVHEDDHEEIHYIKGKTGPANETLCGRKLSPISTVHIRVLEATCWDCFAEEGRIIREMEEKEEEERNKIPGRIPMDTLTLGGTVHV